MPLAGSYLSSTLMSTLLGSSVLLLAMMLTECGPAALGCRPPVHRAVRLARSLASRTHGAPPLTRRGSGFGQSSHWVRDPRAR